MTRRTTINTAKRAMNDRARRRDQRPADGDHHNFYKVEKWTKDGTKVDHMLYAAATWIKRRRSPRRRSSIGRGSD
jgi:hypothetical protein